MNSARQIKLLLIILICVVAYFTCVFHDFVNSYKFENRFFFHDGSVMKVTDKKNGRLYIYDRKVRGYRLVFDGNNNGVNLADRTKYTFKEIVDH